MTENSQTIFRERSLGGLSTPERLDQLLRIVRPQSWILVGIVGIGLVLGVVWATFGRIPETAMGTAILVRPKHVVPFQSPAAGPLASIETSVGESVAKGQLLARIRLPVLEKELELERAKLELFSDRTTELTAMEREHAEEEREFLREQRTLITARIATLERSAELYKDKNASYIAEQRENVKTARTLSEELGSALEARFTARETLAGEGISSKDALVEPRSAVIENRLRLAELGVKAQELELAEILASEKYDDKVDLVQDLNLKLSDLELREMTISRQLREDELMNASERETILRRIGELEAQLDNESRVLAAYGGRILEITVAAGQLVTAGQRIGKMEIEDPGAELMTIAYFEIRDGKKLRPDLPMRISPSTVERERFGGILGVVKSVSDYPVTTAGAANQIGDLEIARNLLGGATRIEVIADLTENPDTYTGYAWTSGKGPESVLITAGTTAEVRVTIQEVRPIALILPFLKSLLGV